MALHYRYRVRKGVSIPFLLILLNARSITSLSHWFCHQLRNVIVAKLSQFGGRKSVAFLNTSVVTYLLAKLFIIIIVFAKMIYMHTGNHFMNPVSATTYRVHEIITPLLRDPVESTH